MLQCGHKIARRDLTLHNIARHYFDITNGSLQQHLKAYFAKDYHMDWLEFVSIKFLNNKGLTREEYLQYMLKPKCPVDELGLLIIACVYRIHIAVVMRDWTWTMGHNYPVDRCTIVLAFRGKLSFMLTCDYEVQTDNSDNFCEVVDTVSEEISSVQKSIELKNETLRILAINNLLPDNIPVVGNEDLIENENRNDSEESQLGMSDSETGSQLGIYNSFQNLGSQMTDSAVELKSEIKSEPIMSDDDVEDGLVAQTECFTVENSQPPAPPSTPDNSHGTPENERENSTDSSDKSTSSSDVEEPGHSFGQEKIEDSRESTSSANQLGIDTAQEHSEHDRQFSCCTN